MRRRAAPFLIAPVPGPAGRAGLIAPACVTDQAGPATRADSSWAGYFVTGPTLRNTGPRAEHARKGNGTIFALVWLGGKSRSPAAVTGLHSDAG